MQAIKPVEIQSPDNFWQRVPHRPGPHACWLWMGTRSSGGYGLYRETPVFRQGQVSLQAHRVAYTLLVGPIPDGLVIDHLCRTRCCVNPSHLEAVTVGENTRRGILGTPECMPELAARRLAQTHCIHGHEFTPENTYMQRGKWRQCRTCQRLRYRKRVAS